MIVSAGKRGRQIDDQVPIVAGKRQKVHFFCLDLPQSHGCFVKAYPRETTGAFLDGHVSGFGFFGGVPLSVLYDHTRLAVARITGDGKRERTRAFTSLFSYYLFRDRFGRPGKGNDMGKVGRPVKPVRIASYAENPPGPGWDGVLVAANK